MHAGNSLGEKHCIWDNSCKLLPAALVSADLTSVNTTHIPTNVVSTSPSKAGVPLVAPPQISCPHHYPPYSQNSCFSLLSDQNNPLVFTRHFVLSYIQNPLLGAQLKPPGRAAGSSRVLDHSSHSCLDYWFRGFRPLEIWIIFLWNPSVTLKQF